MIVLKIIGITLAAIILLIVLILLLRAKVIICYNKEKGFRVGFGVAFLKFMPKSKDKAPKNEETPKEDTAEEKPKKEKKKSKLVEKIKKRLGLDVFDFEELKNYFQEGKLSDKIAQIVAIVMLFFDRIKWLFAQLRVDRLGINAVCGGDSAEAALEYGLVCATVYPLSGFITNNINIKKKAENIQIGCDFDGEAYLEFDLTISVKIYHIFKLAIDCLKDLAVIAEKAEVFNNERGKQ